MFFPGIIISEGCFHYIKYVYLNGLMLFAMEIIGFDCPEQIPTSFKYKRLEMSRTLTAPFGIVENRLKKLLLLYIPSAKNIEKMWMVCQ